MSEKFYMERKSKGKFKYDKLYYIIYDFSNFK